MWNKFEYLRPSSIGAALDFVAKYGNEAAIFAGGTDLLIGMRAGEIKPRYVIDIRAIPGLSQIKYENGTLSLGAAVTWSALAKSEPIQQEFDIFVEAADVFGSPQIRNMATIGGNICSASPSCDMGPPLLVLDAKITAVSGKGERGIPVKEFFLGRRQSSLERGEILKEIQIGTPSKNMGTAFLKIRRSGVDIAIVNVAAAVTVRENRFEDVRIALGGVAPKPMRALKAEEQLKGKACTDENVEKVAETASGETSPISDVRASAEYRMEVSKVLVRRAIRNALEKVGG